MKRQLFISSLAALVLAVAVPMFAASYTTVKVPGSVEDAAFGINNNFQVVGRFTPPSGGVYGFLLSNGKYTTLQFPGQAFTYAFGVNDSGEVVGSYASGPNDHGYIYQNGTYTELDYPGSAWTDLFGINNAGDIVGVYRDANNYEQGFEYSNGTFTKIQVPGAAATVPSGINNDGVIAGTYYSTRLTQSWGFTWQNGNVTTINYPGTQGVTSVSGINDANTLVGNYVNSSAQRVDGFARKSSGQFEHLRYPGATQTQPQAINNKNYAVGQYGVPQGQGLQIWAFAAKLP